MPATSDHEPLPCGPEGTHEYEVPDVVDSMTSECDVVPALPDAHRTVTTNAGQQTVYKKGVVMHAATFLGQVTCRSRALRESFRSAGGA